MSLDAIAASILEMKAHQYLYCVIGRPVISDREYDEFCRTHGLSGCGGSDCANDYSAAEIEYANKLRDAKTR